MNVFKIISRLLLLGLTWLLIAYWVAFIGYTIMRLVTGGPSAVVVWYMHITHVNGAPVQWSWSAFLARQIGILAITLALCFLGRHNPNSVRQSGKV